jgi:hypothetical protein
VRRIRLRADVSSLSTRRWLGRVIQGLLIAALAPCLIWLAPASDWDQPGLLLVLLVLAIIGDFNEVPLPGGLRFDAGLPLALITLVILGPVPALLVGAVPIFVVGFARGERVVRYGNLGNVVAFGYEAFFASLIAAAAGVSELGWQEALPWLMLAGLAMCVVNFVVGPCIFLALTLGRMPFPLVRGFFGPLPAALVMVGLAAITAVLYPALSVLALAIFALIAVLPQTALTFAARTRAVATLDPLTATRRYSHALALHLGLDRAERRHLARVTNLAFQRREEAGDPIAYARQTLRDPSRASWEAGHVGEWWNGGGGPAGLRGPI